MNNELTSTGVNLGGVLNNAGFPTAPTDLGATGGPTAPVLLSNNNYQISSNYFSTSQNPTILNNNNGIRMEKSKKEKELAEKKGKEYYESLKQDETLALINLIEYHQHLYNSAVILNDIEKQKEHSNSYYFFLGQLEQKIRELEFLESKSGIPQEAPRQLTNAEERVRLNRSLADLRKSYNKSRTERKKKGGFNKNKSNKSNKSKKTKKTKKNKKINKKNK